jgi:CRP-like cAMP-binding protein
MSANKIVLNAGDILMREGDHSKSMYWIQKGELIVTRKKGAEEVVLGYLSHGELVGELSFLDHEARSATVKALVYSELVEIPQEAVQKVFESQPKWLETLVMTLAERLRKTSARVRV